MTFGMRTNTTDNLTKQQEVAKIQNKKDLELGTKMMQSQDLGAKSKHRVTNRREHRPDEMT